MDNAVLNKYKPEDFAYYSGYTMAREALTKKNPQIFHYQLYTPDYFEKHLKGTNNHYPDKIYKMTITKEVKNDKVIASTQEKRPNENSITADLIVHANTITDDSEQEEKIHSSAELDPKPEFPGGLGAFYSAVNKEFKVPKVDNDMTAKIYVSFVVEKDGSMSNIKILRDPGFGLGDEAMRVLKKIGESEKWKPGIIKGEKVRASWNLPITINITK